MPSAVQVDAGQQTSTPTIENGVKAVANTVNGDTPKAEETKVEANGTKEEKKDEGKKDDKKEEEEKEKEKKDEEKKDGDDSDSDSDDDEESSGEKKTPKDLGPFGALKDDETITLLIDALQTEKKKREDGRSDKKKASINDFKRVDYGKQSSSINDSRMSH